MSYIDIIYVFVYWANKDACLLACTLDVTDVVTDFAERKARKVPF